MGGPLHLSLGDLVLLITDGVFEAQDSDGHMFGLARMHEAVASVRHLNAAQIVAHLHAAIRRHCAPMLPQDDVTIVVLKVDAAAVA